MADRLKNWARVIKRDVQALYLASRDPRVPWYAKALALVVVGYALSPIDLIPDFIPVLGYLDDVILLPLGILLVIRLIPPEIMAEHRDLAAAAQERGEPQSGCGDCLHLGSLYWTGGMARLSLFRALKFKLTHDPDAAAPEEEAGRGLCDGFGGRERGSRPARHGEPTWQPPIPRSS